MSHSGMFNRTLSAISICTGLALSTMAFAADAKPDPVSAEMKAMDTSHDGSVSAAEHAAFAKAMYEKMDADHNGQVTTTEMDASRKTTMKGKNSASDTSSASMIKTLDTNKDGMLSAEEHAIGAKDKFDLMDTNHDGQLSEDEMRVGHDQMLDAPSNR